MIIIIMMQVLNYWHKGKYSIVNGSDTIDDCLEYEADEISDIGSEQCEFCEIGKWARKRISCINLVDIVIH